MVYYVVCCRAKFVSLKQLCFFNMMICVGICVCVTVSYFIKAILLLHWNSYLFNINNNCSLPSLNLLAGFE